MFRRLEVGQKAYYLLDAGRNSVIHKCVVRMLPWGILQGYPPAQERVLIKVINEPDDWDTNLVRAFPRNVTADYEEAKMWLFKKRLKA